MITNLFPSAVYQSSLVPRGAAAINREIGVEAYQIKKVDLQGRQWSRKNYSGGYTSYSSMDQLHRFSTTFEDLEKQIRRHVFKYVKALELDVDPRELKMSTCWINIMSRKVTHAMHLHPLSVISGTYYVQTPKGGGSLKLEDPRLDHMMAAPQRKVSGRPENQRHYHVKPKAGDVVLFESWMRHEVPPNQSTEDRISVSFNYDWVGR